MYIVDDYLDGSITICQVEMNMKKVAVIIAPGFEEGEALMIVDILRRGQIQCNTIGFFNECK